MFVCICSGITEKDIEDAVQKGASSIHDIAFATGAGTGCGSCVATTMKIILDKKSSTVPPSLPQLSVPPK